MRRCHLQLEPKALALKNRSNEAPRQGAGTLWPTTALRFQGSIEVLGVDDIGPQLELSYLQPDSQSVRPEGSRGVESGSSGFNWGQGRVIKML